MAAGLYENTKEYLENETYRRLTNQSKFIHVGLRNLMQHYKGEKYLHPQQIKFIIKAILESTLYFEEVSMKAYEELPKDLKERIEEYYQNNLAFSVKTNEVQTRKTPPEIIDAFNNRQEENYKRVHDTAKQYLENN